MRTREQLESELKQFFDVPAQYDNSEYHLRPSVLSTGYANVVLGIIDHLLENEAEEPLKPGAFLRTLCGYAWESDYYALQVSANVDIKAQVPLLYNHRDVDIYGTCDFIVTTDDTLTVVDTKCVATKVAEQLRQGYEGLGYHNQLRWYIEMIRDHAVQTDQDISTVGLFGQLAVLDRNYLNFEEHVVLPWEPEQFRKQLAQVDKYVDLMLACQERDESTIMNTLDRAFEYVHKTGHLHAYAAYRRYGKCFKWSNGSVVETKPRVTARYFDAVRSAIKTTANSYRFRRDDSVS